jgi:hypothetical protein
MVENGPFDGLMGFSQGATASALIALIQQLGLGFQVSLCRVCYSLMGRRLEHPDVFLTVLLSFLQECS